MLDVLMFLLHINLIEGRQLPDHEAYLIDQLEDYGFEPIEIDKAFAWLDGLQDLQRCMDKSHINTTTSMRLFSKEELLKIDTPSRSFITFLEQIKVINPNIREVITDRLMALESSRVDLNTTKWVTLMVFFNQPNAKVALSSMENLILAEAATGIH